MRDSERAMESAILKAHTIKDGGVEKVWTLNLNQKMRQSLMKKGAPVWAIGAGTMIGGAEDKQDVR